MSDYNAAVYHEQGSTAIVVSSSGVIRFEGSGAINDTGKWDDMRVPASAVRLPGAQAPGWSTFIGGINALWFDAGTEESVYFAAQIPHDWKPQSDLSPHIHWCTTAATTAIVRWGLEYSYAQIGSTFTAATTLHTTDNSTGDKVHTITSLDADIDMSGVSSSAVSVMFMCRLFRDSSNAADTYASDAGLLEFDFHYQRSRLGSTAKTG